MANEKKRVAARAATALALPALLSLLCALIERRNAGGFAAAFAGEYVLYAAALWALWALTGRAYPAWLAGAVPLLLTLIDHFRRMINGEPLTLSDFSLAPQFGEILAFAVPQLRLSAGIVLALVLYAAALAALIVKREVLTPPRGRARALAWLCGASVFALLLFSSFGTALWSAVADRPETQSAVVPRLLYAYRVKNEPEVLPDGLDWAPEEAGGGTEEPEEAERPTVIFLMSESFFDCTELPNVSFDEDPLANFHALEKTSRHGKFLSHTYAGGTGYVEMEVLTGLCGSLLREGDNLCSLPEEAYQTLPCIADVFDAYGYEKLFLHSYSDALYNRRAIYSALGFDGVFFQEDFPEDAAREGGFLSDMALAEKIVSLYEQSEEPMMLYAVSMENHQPYRAEKYGDENDVTLQSDALDEAGIEALRAYAYGAKHADASLGYLTDYFSRTEEKVMIVFWGDHLPNLSLSDGSVYEKLGHVPTSVTTDWTPEELKRMLSTDYLIWTNYECDATEIEEGNTLLGLHVLERLGFRLSGCYAWLADEVEPFYRLYRPRLFVDSGGGPSSGIPEQYAGEMERYRAVVRDAAYNGCRLFPHEREENAA